MTRIALFLTIFTSLTYIPPASTRLAVFSGIENYPRPLDTHWSGLWSSKNKRPLYSAPNCYLSEPHDFPSPTSAPSNETNSSTRIASSTTASFLSRIANVSNSQLPLIPILPPIQALVPVPLISGPQNIPLPMIESAPETSASFRTVTPQKKVESRRTKSSTKTTASLSTRPSTKTTTSLKTKSSRRSTTSSTTASSTYTSASATMPKLTSFRKRRNLEKFVKALETDCDFDLLNEVYKDLKDLWVEARKDGSDSNQNEIEELQKFLKNLIEQYNKCVEKMLDMDLDRHYEIYRKIFGKEYNEKEKEIRRAIFEANMDNMIKHNELYRNGLTSYSTNLNSFSDSTQEELHGLRGFRPSNATIRRRQKRRDFFSFAAAQMAYRYKPYNKLPDSFIWGADYISPVRHQGKCGSSYAFAGIGALEAYHKRKTGELIDLSAQNILDCTWHLGNKGCQGGEALSVFDYARMTGVVANRWYLYTMNASHNCRWKREHVTAMDRGYYIIPKGNEKALQHAVASLGPVAVGIGTKGIHQYRSGVFHTSDCGPANHAVLVVGYGINPWLGDYWTVKNCWGFAWGDEGYVRIARNKHNMCYIASHAYLPY